jgi:hypothetical protein
MTYPTSIAAAGAGLTGPAIGALFRQANISECSPLFIWGYSNGVDAGLAEVSICEFEDPRRAGGELGRLRNELCLIATMQRKYSVAADRQSGIYPIDAATIYPTDPKRLRAPYANRSQI